MWSANPSTIFASDPSSKLSGHLDSNFWDQLVLQISHDDPAVRHAVISVGSMYEKFNIQRQFIHQQAHTIVCRQYSIEPYKQALAQLQQNLGDDENGKFRSTLVCCVLFIAFETFLGNYDSARLHLESGLKILHDWQIKQDRLLHPTYPPATSMMEDDPFSIFSRLNLQARSLVDPGLSQHHRFIENTATKSISNAFSSLNQSRIYLYVYSTHELNKSIDILEEPP